MQFGRLVITYYTWCFFTTYRSECPVGFNHMLITQVNNSLFIVLTFFSLSTDVFLLFLTHQRGHWYPPTGSPEQMRHHIRVSQTIRTRKAMHQTPNQSSSTPLPPKQDPTRFCDSMSEYVNRSTRRYVAVAMAMATMKSFKC